MIKSETRVLGIRLSLHYYYDVTIGKNNLERTIVNKKKTYVGDFP